MAVGFPAKTTYANGDVFSASDINDTNGTINLLTSSTLSSSAGKNFVINGGMDIWQRGTTFTATANLTYLADRWLNSTGTSLTVTRDIDVPTSPYFQYSMKLVGLSDNSVSQRIESANSILLAGKTVTFSFYAKRTSGTGALDVRFYYPSATDNFTTNTQIGSTVVVSASPSSSWTRYSATVAIGTNITTGLQILINNTGAATTFITGCQLELGSTATTFSRAGGTIQGELAACQRYYYRASASDAYGMFASGAAGSTTNVRAITPFPVQMRVAPTSVEYSTLGYQESFAGAPFTVTAVSLVSGQQNNTCGYCNFTVAGVTATRSGGVGPNNSTSAYLGFSGEL